MSEPVYVSLEFTPNPNTLKYSVNRELLAQGAAGFTDKKDAEARSPLAASLFAIDGISGVMIGRDFVTITKSEDGDWDAVHKNASVIIEQHLVKGLQIITPEALKNLSVQKGGNTDIERKIREILDAEIRPAVAMDGGDISFGRFENGIVYLHLEGSCSGCPSSTATLKMGIETRLREAIPEVLEVVSL